MKIDLKIDEAFVLAEKLTEITCRAQQEQRKKWSKAWLSFCGETQRMACVNEHRDEIGFKGEVLVEVELEHAKTVFEVLTDHLSSNFAKKDQLGKALSRLEEAIDRAEKEKGQA